MKSLAIFLILITLRPLQLSALEAGAIFTYNCQIGNAHLFQDHIDHRRISVSQSGNFKVELTKKRPVLVIPGQLSRFGEMIDVEVELRGMRLSTNLEDVPRVAVKLKDITNDRELFFARGIDAIYRVKNDIDGDENDITVNCKLISEKPRQATRSELARLFALFFLSLKN